MSYEYSLVRGINDAPEQAQALSRLLKGKNCHVNLIPVNPVEERDYESSGEKTVARFQKILEKNGINATIRKKMGADIDGACGQLRRRLMD
ncbi:MAG: 23S rRNA (adenine(2503)-C(2))-methyltransferase RlmN, partial [Lachnospiraceae bacterium]|nr:23S rRNA (adenine(2503)-C(2))-methyltransferase RlmN [Lachnospiraceae bacterium]